MKCLRLFVTSLFFLLAVSWHGRSEVVWTDEQMQELEGLIQQADSLIQTQEVQLSSLKNELSDLNLQLQQQSKQISRLQKQSRNYKTLCIVLGTVAISSGVVWYVEHR